MQPNRTNPRVSTEGFCVAVESYRGVHMLKIHRQPLGMHIDKPIQYGDLNGLQFNSTEEAFAAALDHGYEQRASRNTYEFHRSRASRKRGFPDMNNDSSWQRKLRLGENQRQRNLGLIS